MLNPSKLSLGYIHCPRGHVTVLMLKNALVNINRPGWQDKFAFMAEEEKTSIPLTQKLHHYCSGGPSLIVPRSQSQLCVSVLLKLVLLASKQWLMANTSTSSWLAATCGSLLHSWAVCEILRPVGNCPSLANQPSD